MKAFADQAAMVTMRSHAKTPQPLYPPVGALIDEQQVQLLGGHANQLRELAGHRRLLALQLLLLLLLPRLALLLRVLLPMGAA